MLSITGHELELINDPFGILPGNRFEFLIDLDVPEDDELYSENGVYLKVIYVLEDDKAYIAKYDFYENETEKYIDLELEEDEEEQVNAYCRDNLIPKNE
ncbi:pullulanase [Peribacillus saganii]|uniref:Pullulanase n=1 Tax=Peribacillus saganii TaxID=2303992 RepID=A0A372LRM9_9BACI|nr:DUF6509 family protein [Peribacillus saganii]RFU70442.1 pullulanase [Peribacillus saganii]